jgi:hypothetical protein
VFCMQVVTYCPLKFDNIDANVISRIFELLKIL